MIAGLCCKLCRNPLIRCSIASRIVKEILSDIKFPEDYIDEFINIERYLCVRKNKQSKTPELRKLFENEGNDKVKKKPGNKKKALKKAGNIEKSNGINTVNGINGLKKSINKISQLLENIENRSKEYETSETEETKRDDRAKCKAFC
jgi:hypothetical protein